MTMEIILLGKRLEDYPETEYYEKRLIYTTYSSGFREHNIAAFKSRLKKYFDYEIVNHFVKDEWSSLLNKRQGKPILIGLTK